MAETPGGPNHAGHCRLRTERMGNTRDLSQKDHFTAAPDLAACSVQGPLWTKMPSMLSGNRYTHAGCSAEVDPGTQRGTVVTAGEEIL
jgi:hypothetical protein